MRSSKGRSLASSIEDIRQKHRVPALAVMTMKGGKIVGSAFVGIRKVGDPMPICAGDQFHLGSDTKAMTATLIAILIEQGKLRWDTPLGDIFLSSGPVRSGGLNSYWIGAKFF